MTSPTTQRAGHAGPQGQQLSDLIDRAGDLKGELVRFGQGPAFAKHLRRVLAAATGADGFLDEGAAISAIDRFLLQDRLPDGRTVIERFVAQRRPRLSDGDRQMLLGWQDVIEGCFEVRRFVGEGFLLHNLLDDLTYLTYSNVGRAALHEVRRGGFVIGRIVPLAPGTDLWLMSGSFGNFSKHQRKVIAKAAVGSAHPDSMRRNPDLMRRAWEIQSSCRADFIDLVGSDLVVLPPLQAQETMREHFRRLQDGATTTISDVDVLDPEQAGGLTDELLTAQSVAILYDEVEGLLVYRDFGRLDELFADPGLARQPGRLRQLRGFLDDDSVSPAAVRRLVERHPDGADEVFRRLLRDPRFT